MMFNFSQVLMTKYPRYPLKPSFLSQQHPRYPLQFQGTVHRKIHHWHQTFLTFSHRKNAQPGTLE